MIDFKVGNLVVEILDHLSKIVSTQPALAGVRNAVLIEVVVGVDPGSNNQVLQLPDQLLSVDTGELLNELSVVDGTVTTHIEMSE